jgi:hypothetical protein
LNWHRSTETLDAHLHLHRQWRSRRVDLPSWLDRHLHLHLSHLPTNMRRRGWYHPLSLSLSLGLRLLLLLVVMLRHMTMPIRMLVRMRSYTNRHTTCISRMIIICIIIHNLRMRMSMRVPMLDRLSVSGELRCDMSMWWGWVHLGAYRRTRKGMGWLVMTRRQWSWRWWGSISVSDLLSMYALLLLSMDALGSVLLSLLLLLLLGGNVLLLLLGLLLGLTLHLSLLLLGWLWLLSGIRLLLLLLLNLKLMRMLHPHPNMHMTRHHISPPIRDILQIL